MKEVSNRKAKFEYQFLQEYETGVMLLGTEVKSIKAGDANLSDAYCMFVNDELYLKSMYVAEYDMGPINNHETRRDRKLLLRKPELKKLQRRVKEKGQTIVPYELYIIERNIIKIQIVLATGKKEFDKQASIKDKDAKRDMDRVKKMNL